MAFCSLFNEEDDDNNIPTNRTTTKRRGPLAAFRKGLETMVMEPIPVGSIFPMWDGEDVAAHDSLPPSPISQLSWGEFGDGYRDTTPRSCTEKSRCQSEPLTPILVDLARCDTVSTSLSSSFPSHGALRNRLPLNCSETSLLLPPQPRLGVKVQNTKTTTAPTAPTVAQHSAASLIQRIYQAHLRSKVLHSTQSSQNTQNTQNSATVTNSTATTTKRDSFNSTSSDDSAKEGHRRPFPLKRQRSSGTTVSLSEALNSPVLSDSGTPICGVLKASASTPHPKQSKLAPLQAPDEPEQRLPTPPPHPRPVRERSLDSDAPEEVPEKDTHSGIGVIVALTQAQKLARRVLVRRKFERASLNVKCALMECTARPRAPRGARTGGRGGRGPRAHSSHAPKEANVPVVCASDYFVL